MVSRPGSNSISIVSPFISQAYRAVRIRVRSRSLQQGPVVIEAEAGRARDVEVELLQRVSWFRRSGSKREDIRS